MSDAVIGTEVDGYRIQAVLGRGGMGTVYKAEDVNLSRTVAIKRINPGQQEREAFIHRFRSEAQALARIDSPHIVGVYALRETDIGLLIVMEYVEGGTLKDPLDRQGALMPNQAIPILEQTLEAFDDAHSAGVIHRDIKPENVMLTQDGMVKVTDFGIAKLRQPDSGETVTQGGQGGTLKYMSPEQISSIDDVDARSDVYSLGMTAYEMLAGDLPFTETDTDFDIMRKVVEGKIPPPDELNSDIPSGIAQWVVGAIQKEQDDRYQSAEEMKEALHEADQQSGEKTVTQPDWEVEGDHEDVDETQTVVPGSEEQTQTAVPGDDQTVDADDETGPDPEGQTVMDPETAMGAEGATQPAVPKPDAAEEESPEPPVSEEAGPETDETDETNWLLVGGGLVVLLLMLVGGYVAFTQLGGSSGTTATLSVTTTPAGAMVLVNGDTVDTTPISSYAMEAGTVQLQVEKEGYNALDTTFTARAGGRISLQNVTLAESESGDTQASDATLADNTEGASSDDVTSSGSASDPSSTEPATNQTSSSAETVEADDPIPQEDASSNDASTASTNTGTDPATGLVEVTPEPSGTVLVDGAEQGTGGAMTLTEGEHTVTCRHPQHGSVQKTVTVSAGQRKRLTCYFEYTVVVNTKGAWGRIWVDGQNTGKNTNATEPLRLPPGEHQIEVRRESMDGFRVNGGRVKIERDGNAEYEEFSGQAYRIDVEPSFTKMEYAVVFTLEN